MADQDDLVPGPDPDGEGAGAMPQDAVGSVVGAVERRYDAPAAQPDEGGAQQPVWQLSQQLDTGIVPRQGKRRSIRSFFLHCYQLHQRKIHLRVKICWAGQLECQKLPQPRKDQCLPLAVHGGRGAQ